MTTATIDIMQTIGRDAGEMSSQEFIRQLNSVPEDVEGIIVNINSEGGSVFEGNAIAEAIKQHPAKVTTQCIGSALSIASVIFLAGDERLIAENGWVMIHEPMTESWGTAQEIRQQADLIDGIRVKMIDDYAGATKLSAKQAESMMKDETWMDANDSIKYGFADGVTGRSLAVAISNKNFKNMPKRLIASCEDAPCGDVSNVEETRMSENTVGQTIAAIRARCRGANDQFILTQLEAGTSIDEITAIHNDAQAKEIEELKQALAIAEATIATYEEEMAKDDPEEMAEEKPEEKPEAEEEKEEPEAEEEEKKEAAVAKGALRPVATKYKKGAAAATFRAQWHKAIADYMDSHGVTRDRAIKMVNRNHPGLREQVVNESQVNQSRQVAV